jgi:hypothetical protein
MTPAEEAYCNYKESVEKGYAGGLISEITNYVKELEAKVNRKDRQIERLKKIIVHMVHYGKEKK